MPIKNLKAFSASPSRAPLEGDAENAPQNLTNNTVTLPSR